MKKSLKKIMASALAVATMAVSVVGMNANAITQTDAYSSFTYNRYYTSANCTMDNTSGTSGRYIQSSMTIYF